MSSVSGQIQGRTVISKTPCTSLAVFTVHTMEIKIIDIAMDRFCISSLDY